MSRGRISDDDAKKRKKERKVKGNENVENNGDHGKQDSSGQVWRQMQLDRGSWPKEGGAQ